MPEASEDSHVAGFRKRFLLIVVGLALIALVAWRDLKPIGDDVLRASWSLLFIVPLHLVQLFFSGLAWRCLIEAKALSRLTMFCIRWIREAVNSLLPLAQIGGMLVSIRLVTQRGISVAAATASTTLDTLTEAIGHLAFILLSLTLLVLSGHTSPVIVWITEGVVLVAIGLGALYAAQSRGWLWRLEAAIIRLGRRFPILHLQSLQGLDQEMKQMLQNRRRALESIGLHFLSWILGGGEVFVVLWAIGVPVNLQQALIIESLGTAARSIGFVIPGGLGVQEGGFVLVCGLFGIHADAAVALSMVKRLREVVAGVPGLLLWQRAEFK